ncbi:hypothetical protein BD324DRAFT_650825 [Kockovaella imperatae]|uniref:SHSP domain-containing protein n=1 Tax=Kockovaella imperatae TaxID=4999 RepID=A0A1Y1UGX4_9TREE|nr:hypothetical protein BD324DRAFT_650825 [Kockovaella imperatae]ORX37219.1 hypothetical protein BD324DRAFT_650825 [Kockovaella imperatae]
MQHEPLTHLETQRLSAPYLIPTSSSSPSSSRSSSSSMLTSPQLDNATWQVGTIDIRSEGHSSSEIQLETLKPPNEPGPKNVYLPPNRISLSPLIPDRPTLTRGNTSPASSVTSTAPSRGEATPRSELPAPIWPLLSRSSSCNAGSKSPDAMDVDQDDLQARTIEPSLRSHHTSLDASQLATPSRPPDSRRQSAPLLSSSELHRVVADSSHTGCRISAPLSPPAHYPGSALRRESFGRPASQASASSSVSASTPPTSISSRSTKSEDAPRWARPPRHFDKITGRAWSFSQGQERPDVDFDPELFDGSDPDTVEEVMKGTDGRIAVKTTTDQHVILVWLPGITINDITISSKGDRTVQIVADRWDEDDHLEWNVLLGKDANMKAIAAKLEGSELKVTIQRKAQPSVNKSIRSAFTSWSGPARLLEPNERI